MTVDHLIASYNYWIYVILMMIGLYAMLAKNNLVKKLIGLTIFQTAIIVFFISIAAKRYATIPIIEHGGGSGASEHAVQASHYVNPLPHVLMLTAIVVSVATLGVALAMVIRIHECYASISEDEILERLQ